MQKFISVKKIFGVYWHFKGGWRHRHVGFVPGRGGMGPGGLRATFLSAFEKEDGFLIPVASPVFFKSDGFKGNEVGLSSDDCLRSRASTGLSGGLTGTLGGLAAPVISGFFSPVDDCGNGFF